MAVVIRRGTVRHMLMRSRHAYMMLESVDVTFVVIDLVVVASLCCFCCF